MSRLCWNTTAIAQWQALVKDAESTSHLMLDENLESYLVFLLGRFNQRPDWVNCVLATDFLTSFEKNPFIQRDCLRDIGDKCLLFAGFFPEQAEKRHVKIKYFVDLGKTAYIQVAHLSQAQSATLFQELSYGFVRLMEVLHAIRGSHNPTNELTPLQAVELWNEVNSQHALTILQRHTSALIVRGSSNKH